MNKKSTSNNALPIIFIHLGNSYYLKYALECAKRYNPDSRIILLGKNVTDYPAFVEKYNINSFNSFAKRFIQKYKHMSINKPKIERFCFERWFYLTEFLEKQKIEKCLTLDSDVLLYKNVTKDQLHFKEYDFTLANKVSGGFMFINNIDKIKDFCNFTYKLYNNKKTLKKMKEFFDKTKNKKIRGMRGINDMYALNLYYKNNNAKIGDISKVINDTTYDIGIHVSQGMEMKGGIKKIIFKQGIPYCIRKKDNKLIRMKSLHMSGPNKFYMKYFLEGRNTKLIQYNVKIKKWLRDYLSPKLNPKQINFFKKIMKITKM